MAATRNGRYRMRVQWVRFRPCRNRRRPGGPGPSCENRTSSGTRTGQRACTAPPVAGKSIRPTGRPGGLLRTPAALNTPNDPRPTLTPWRPNLMSGADQPLFDQPTIVAARFRRTGSESEAAGK